MKQCLAFMLAAMLSCAQAFAQTAGPAPADWNAGMRSQTLTAAEKALNRYFFADKIAAITAALEAHRGDLVTVGDPQKFADAVTKVLYGAAHDKHLGLWYSADALPPSTPGKPSAAEIADRAREDLFMDYGYSSSARLPGNIGFLRIAFFPPPPASKRMYDEAMGLLAHTDALIIDVRGNGGGSPGSVDYLLGYFFAKPVEVTGFLFRDGGKTIARRMFSAGEIGGPRYVDKPVYLLTNQYTISGGEQFVYDMKSLHRAQLVGATTAGGANIGGPVRLNDHFSIFIPRGTARNPYTGTNWEGTGVKPDVAVNPREALLKAYTLALKTARNSWAQARDDRTWALKDPAKALRLVLPEQ